MKTRICRSPFTVAAVIALLIGKASFPAGQGRSEAELIAGRQIFDTQCAICHGVNGAGGRGPSLTRPRLNRAPDDQALRRLIVDGVLPEMPGTWQLSESEVDLVAGYVRSLGAVPPETLTGDAARGAQLYRKLGCPGCHILSGSGNGAAPELTGIGAKRNAAFLREALLRPAASLPDGYLVVVIHPARGPAIRGVRLNEDSFSLQIQDDSGKFHSFRKQEIREFTRLPQQSTMPSFEKKVTPSELEDLVAYLAGTRGEQ